MKARMLGVAVLGVALVAPGSALAKQASVKGVVIERDAQTSQIVVAPQSGALLRVRVDRVGAFKLGARVRASGRVTATGIVAGRVARTGKAAGAHVEGTVLRSRKGYMLVARNGAVVRIATSRRAAAGSAVSARVQITRGRLVARTVKVEDRTADELEAKGTVTAVDATAGTITFNLAEDDSVVTILIGGADVTGLDAGDVVEIEAAIARAEDGTVTYTLVRWHAEDCSEDHGAGHGDQGEVEVDGVLRSVDDASVVVTVAGQDVVFARGAVDLTGFEVGQTVEAKGYVIDDVLTLVRIEHEDSLGDDDHGDDDRGHGSSDDDGMGGHGGHGGHGGDDPAGDDSGSGGHGSDDA